jgi:ABC-type multidrug transport system fused ATPase/permease subunit
LLSRTSSCHVYESLNFDTDIPPSALNLFNLLETNLRELPGLVTTLLNCFVAMGRIESFMAEADREDSRYDEEVAPAGELSIDIENSSFAWPGQSMPVLRNVSIQCEPGLTMVFGKVGSGKTALLQAILGEMDQIAGNRKVPKEMIGYCAQMPWLQSMSIKENILFCSPYDKTRFEAVIDACCLKQDLEAFPAAEESFIGENGIGLSGGQRARVALARAVYSNSRIVLLDDPIAALDHHTAETIMWRLFSTSGLMKDRLVVFVTHRVDVITEYAAQIIEVRDDGTTHSFHPNEIEPSQELADRVDTQNGNTVEHHLESFDGAAETVVAEKFIEEEHRAHGDVMASVYWRYVKAGKVRWWVCIILCFIVYRSSKVAYFYFLKLWGEAYGNVTSHYLAAMWTDKTGLHGAKLPVKSLDWIDGIDLGLPPPEQNVMPWLFWFAALSLSQMLAGTLSDLFLIVITYTAGRKMFRDVMFKVANANFRFFDLTPVGRLMNRVTSDMGTIDGAIATQLHVVFWFGFNWLAAMTIIGTATPLFLLLAIIMTIIFVMIFLRFLPASQSLRRLEMVSLSPLMSNFGIIVEGLTTVRAFRAQKHFQQRNIEITDDFQQMDHFYWSLQAWIQFRFDALSSFSTFALTLTAFQVGLSSGSVAFVLAAAANFVNSTHILCRKYGELQMQFVSVERVVELLDLETEPIGDIDPPAAWPTNSDDITFEDVNIRYAPTLEPILRDINLRIPAGSTVAVTGRTGSGKTTLALALLGTVLPDPPSEVGGRGYDRPESGIFIGGLNIARVNKRALRQRISFVAQDPVLFPGTLRENLDPIGDYTDEECTTVIERVMGDSGRFTIDTPVDAGGKNLSQGQRQLVGLARAVLRRSPIVIMDEVCQPCG